MSKSKTIVDVRVNDVEKWRYPNKHYVYVLEVTWSEGTKTIIYRRYSRFFEFQCKLLELFPEEGGTNDPTQRMIPFLPGKKLFSRSHTRKVAVERQLPINEYCRQLIRLPSKLSDSSFVIDFFEITEEDIKPQKEKLEKKKSSSCDVISDPVLLERYVAVADYAKQSSNQVELRAGQVVEVVEKNQHGWWFINCSDDFSEGWVPANFLEPLDKNHEEENLNEVLETAENHITTAVYQAQGTDEISFEKGVVVKVMEKKLDGWWKVDYQGVEGYVPAIYLELYCQEVDEGRTGATYAVSSVEAAVSQTLADQQQQQGRSQDDSDRPRPQPPRRRRGSDSGPASSLSLPSTSPTSPTPTSPTSSTSSTASGPVAGRVIFASAAATGTRSKFAKKRSLSPQRSHTATPALKPVSKATQSKPRPQRPPKPVKQSSHEAIYSTITLPPPRKNSIKKSKARPKPKVTRLLPPVVKTEAESTANHSVRQCEDLEGMEAPPPAQAYRTIAAFSSQASDGLSFEGGQTVELVSQNSSGWWFVLLGDKEGWVPSSYLEKCDPPPATPPASLRPPAKTNAGSKSPSPVPRGNTLASKAEKENTSTSPAKPKPYKPPAVGVSSRSDSGSHSPPAKPWGKSASRREPPLPPSSEDPSARKPLLVVPGPAPLSQKEPQSASERGKVAPSDKPRPGNRPVGISSGKPSASEKPQLSQGRSTTMGGKGPAPKPRPRGDTSVRQGDPAPSSVGSELSAILAKRSMTSEGGKSSTSTGPKPSSRAATNGSGDGSRSHLHPSPSASSKPSKPSHAPQPRPSRPSPPASTGAWPPRTDPTRTGPPHHRAAPRPAPRPVPLARVVGGGGGGGGGGGEWVTCEAYSGEGEGTLSFAVGEAVREVVDRSGDWWFVELEGGRQGWVPSTYLEKPSPSGHTASKPSANPKPASNPVSKPSANPKPASNPVSKPSANSKPVSKPSAKPSANSKSVPKPVPKPVSKPVSRPSRPERSAKSFFLALAEFDGRQSGSLSLEEGERVEVRQECEDGWWQVVKATGEEGWVPSTYLEKV